MSQLRTQFTPEFMNRMQVGSLPHLLGLEVLEIAEGTIKGRMEVTPKHYAPNGFLHAASVIALADTLAGYATVAHLPDGAKGFTTIELKSNFFGTVLKGYVFATAVSRHRGRTTQVWDADVSDEKGKLLATFRCTQLVLV
ncbi:MAG: PaaI family thioesterase [Nevskia sp.]